jgi:hypothetical protein
VRSRRFIALVGCAVAASALSVGVAGRSAGAHSAATSGHHFTGKAGVIGWQAPHSKSERAALAGPLAATTVKTFTRKIVDGGNTYVDKIVGGNVFKALTTQTTTIKTKLVPLVLNFNTFGNSFNPTVGDSCDPASTSVLKRTQKSPIFVAQNWSFGGTSVGSAQYVDAFERAEFFKYTKPTGVNPNYHVTLSLGNVAKQTTVAPGAQWEASGLACGNGALGLLNINSFDGYIQGTLLPALVSSGAISDTTFPLILVHNVVFFTGNNPNNPGTCCIIGYHNAIPMGGGTMTYGVADFEDSGAFSPAVHDISAMSHEVGEWMNDPFTNNPTARWGNIGQVGGCPSSTTGGQTNFEVGDPLSGTLLTDNLNGYNYHPQEMAFFSWFYHDVPSIGINGKYSNNGTFGGDAKPCPPGGTN